MKTVKRFGTGFYLGCVAAILGIIAVCMYSANISNAYFADITDPTVIACSVIAIIVLAAYLALEHFTGKNRILDFITGLLPAVACFCLFTAFCTFLQTRVYSMAIIYGSDLEANNALAHSAMAQAIGALVLYFIAAVVAIVGSFSSTLRKEKAD